MRLDALILPHEAQVWEASTSLQVTGLSQNTSTTTRGGLFFAITGHQKDGHQFVAQALAQGAAAAVVERQDLLAQYPKQTVLVSSTRRALALAACRWYGEPSRAFKLVGVTGTNGKTTSTYLLRQVWEQLGHATGLLGTVSCFIGAQEEPSTLTTPDPLTLQNFFHRLVNQGITHAAMEVSSIALDQARPLGTAFAAVLFTNLTGDHLDYHGDMEQYYRAKLRLFTEYGAPCAVINIDDTWGERLARETRTRHTITFSLKASGADYCVRKFETHKEGTTATLLTPHGEQVLRTPLIGRHNLYNCLGVLAVAEALGADPIAVCHAFSLANGAPGRLERVALGNDKPYVFVDYAHSDDALKNVLSSLRQVCPPGQGRIVTVFGAGGDRDRSKRPRMASVVSALADVTIATSDNPRTEDPDRILDDIESGIDRVRTRYCREQDRRKAIGLALELSGPNDIVLIAGKGHETYQIVGTEKLPFDDRQIVRELALG